MYQNNRSSHLRLPPRSISCPQIWHERRKKKKAQTSQAVSPGPAVARSTLSWIAIIFYTSVHVQTRVNRTLCVPEHLRRKPEPLDHIGRQGEDRVDLAVRPAVVLPYLIQVPYEAEPAYPKEGVVHVRHVEGPVGDAAVVLVLAAQYESPQHPRVDPPHPPHDRERRQYPPAVADVGLLLRPAVEPAAVALPLGEPPREEVSAGVRVGPRRLAEEVERPRDGQGPDAAEDLSRVGLGPGHASEAAVEVAAGYDVPHGRLGVYHGRILALAAVVRPALFPVACPGGQRKPAQEGEARQRAVAESRVDLPPPVAAERPVGVLQARDEPHDAVAVETVVVERAGHGEDLQRRERVQEVPVVRDRSHSPFPPAAARAVAPEPARRRVVAVEDEVYDRPALRPVRRPAEAHEGVHVVLAAEEGHGPERPVHARHAKVLSCGALVARGRIEPVAERGDVVHVLCVVERPDAGGGRAAAAALLIRHDDRTTTEGPPSPTAQ
ncbi:hypothetical protein THAOC_27536 [Thalassiosira oceanica]|uniref:Uncharacterized protein n=1 Tax=Thalassiosira oceanica TaxID=159749 RepID=K0S2G1_THAOC|nr:hypothetical protein THAOC_27536 [Thalassiosira oceanica]|eukprot:EJK53092.1 hypothetical protein THAOC_27536 [Thalassiosira oceanica]